MTMRCGRAERSLAAAADGELSARQQRALDRHLAGCPTCRGELVTTGAVLRALSALPMEAEVPARLEQATLRRVRLAAAEETERGPGGWWSVWRLPAFGAAVVAVVAVSVALLPSAEGPSRPASAPGRTQVARSASQPREAPARQVASDKTPRAPIVREVPKEPPPALAEAPDLFIELPILRNLEKLEHFEAIRTTTIDDAPETPGEGQERSNG
jgi:anti-sigma factor RsiW